MEILSKFMIGLIAISMIATSCEKGGDDLDQNENQNTELPTNENEAFELITKKWDLPQLADYNSIELTKDSLFIVDKVSALKSTNEGSEIITGTFTINSDGVTIILNGFGTMTIEQVSDNLIVITIILEDGTDLGEVTGEEQEVVSTSERTEMLCKSWEMEIQCEKKMNLSFTKSGSLLYNGSSITEGDTCPELTGPFIGVWEWTDDSETDINFIIDGVSETKHIESLSENTLRIELDGVLEYTSTSTSSFIENNSTSIFTEDQLIGLWRYEYTDENDTVWPYELNFYSDKHVTFYTSESENTYEIGTWSFDDNLVTITSADGNDSSTGTINTDNTLTITVGSLENATYVKIE